MMMPEGVKIPQSASPLAREGAGDSSDRARVHTTPPPRKHPAHPKKQLYSVPVNKFTANTSLPSTNLVRIRSCLDEFRQTPARPVKIGPKAVSMEDLTPTKKIKKERKEKDRPKVRSPGLRGVAEEEAAARIGRFMIVASWRRRRDEVRCLRKTLEFQVTCSERLRLQVCALRSLLDSDNAKVRLAMRELERLRQLAKDKDMVRAVLEKEKYALERDVCAAEDRASELATNWRNCRNELERARAATVECERALAGERARALAAIQQVSVLQEEQQQTRAQRDDLRQRLQRAVARLRADAEARARSARECSALSARLELSAQEQSAARAAADETRAQLADALDELRRAREQLERWPRAVQAVIDAVRSWFRHPKTLSQAVLWSVTPARHGC